MTTEQEQPASQRQQEQGQPQPKEQAPVGQPVLNTLLQEQIAQAIQPVLADFRQQFTHSLQTQAETRPATDQNGGGDSVDALQVLPQRPSDEQEPGPAQMMTHVEEPSEAQQPQEQSQDHGIQDRIVPRRFRPALESGLRLAERQGEQWLQSMIVAGLEALLAESAHGAVQQRAEKGLHTLLEKTFDALPNRDSATIGELRDQTERTLQAILREALDAVFAEDVRGTLLNHGKQASSEIAHAHLKGALQQAEQALQTLVQEIADVLRRQWQRVLRLLLRLILTALQDSLVPDEGESLKGISAKSDKEKGTQAEHERQSNEPSSGAEQAG